MMLIKKIKYICATALQKLKKKENKKKVKRIILIIGIIFTLTLITSGYFFIINPLEKRAYKSALKQIQNFKSSEFSLTSAMRLDIESLPDAETAGDQISLKIKIQGLGKIDLPHKKMDVSIKTAIFNQEVSVQEILVDGQVYLQSKAKDPFYKLSEGSVANMTTQLFNFINFKENQNWGTLSKNSTYKYLGKDKVDGKQALRYEIALLEEDSAKSMQKILDNLSANLGDKIDLSLSDIEKSPVKMTVWIDKKTFIPLKEQLTIPKISFTLPKKGLYTLVNVVSEINYRKFNEPVQIEAPANFRELPVQ